jgi:hypothetical protein
MPNASPNLAAVRLNTEAFLELSKIAFSTVERLTALNLGATRAAFEAGVASSTSVLQTANLGTQQGPGASLPENSAAYLRDVREIAVESQKEITKLTASYFTGQGATAEPGGDLLKGFEVFKGFAQQITAMTEANSKAVGDAAAHIAGMTAPFSKKAS